jgi:Flp pilus assembly protein TadG
MLATERHRESQRGAALVEFALVLPLLLVLVFGTIEFGLLMFNQQIITNASREGARFGIVQDIPRKTLAEITAVVTSYTADHLVTFGVPNVPAVSVDNSGGTSFGDDLKVTVTYQYDFLVLPNFITSLAGNVTLRAQTVMKYE